MGKPKPDQRRITLDVYLPDYDTFETAKDADGVAHAQRLRALMSLWQADPKLQAATTARARELTAAERDRTRATRERT